MAIGQGGERRAGGRMFEGVQDVGDPRDDEVVGGREGHGDLGWKPGDGVTDAFGARFPDPYGVAAVGFESWSGVPAVESVR